VIRRYGPREFPEASLGFVAVSSDHRTLAYTVDDGSIHWFEVATGRQIRVAHPDSGGRARIMFQPGTRTVARPTGTSVELWDDRGHLAGQFDGTAEKVRFSADGRLLFGLSGAETLRVWDARSRTLLGTLPALPLRNERGEETADGASYAFRTAMETGPADTLWVAASHARPVGWILSIDSWLRQGCHWADRSLDAAEWRHYVGTSAPSDLSCGG
jgi:WD40 repeat protein